MRRLVDAAVIALALGVPSHAFLLSPLQFKSVALSRVPLSQRATTGGESWDVFKENHVGAWRGIWETFDRIGDKADTSEILFNVDLSPDGESATLSQTVMVASIGSDCEKCFDSSEARVMPLGAVSKESGLGRITVVGPSLVTGPSVLRKSGAMSTEVGLRYGDGRVVVVFQHAPAWARDNPTPGQGPPDALDLFRVIVRREALRDEAPSPAYEAKVSKAAAVKASSAEEAATIEAADGVKFWRGVPPYKWAQEDDGLVWQGSTYSWEQAVGDDGSHSASDTTNKANGGGAKVNSSRKLSFEVAEDVWHERFAGDDENTWHLRLPGGVLLQAPTRIFSGYLDEDSTSYEMRLAWLVEDTTLLRAVAQVTGVGVFEDEASGAVRVSPPSLNAVTADSFTKIVQ